MNHSTLPFSLTPSTNFLHHKPPHPVMQRMKLGVERREQRCVILTFEINQRTPSKFRVRHHRTTIFKIVHAQSVVAHTNLLGWRCMHASTSDAHSRATCLASMGRAIRSIPIIRNEVYCHTPEQIRCITSKRDKRGMELEENG